MRHQLDTYSFARRQVLATVGAGIFLPTSLTAQTLKPQVGLVMKSLANDFFKNMAEGAIAHEKKRGDFTLKAVGMKSETDFEAQVVAVESFIAQKMDIIAITPGDSRAMVASIAKAVKAGITVVNFDVPFDKTTMQQAGIDVAFVGPDNRVGARKAGEELGRTLGAGAKVVIIEGNPGADNALQRKLGFEDAVRSTRMDLVASITAHWETDEAYSVMTKLLATNQEIRGVLAANDSMAIGAVKALDNAGKIGKQIKVVGFDNIPAIRPLIQQGNVLATVDQFGREMAAFAIDYALRARKENQVLKGWIKTPVELVAARNLSRHSGLRR